MAAWMGVGFEAEWVHVYLWLAVSRSTEIIALLICYIPKQNKKIKRKKKKKTAQHNIEKQFKKKVTGALQYSGHHLPRSPLRQVLLLRCVIYSSNNPSR